MGLIQTLREGVSPAVYSRRAPDNGKICQAPSCTIRFYRKQKEPKKDYDLRDTCCAACKRELNQLDKPAPNSEVSYRQLDPHQLSCGNCEYMKEDSEIGEHCGPCSTGQNFLMKERRA